MDPELDRELDRTPAPYEPGYPEIPEDEPGEPLTESIVAWGRAVVFGVRDTARDILSEARKGAATGRAEAWDRYRDKTKYRRHPRD